ncbi:Hypothetical predicted protein [Olea europaea subsp. europaea]|uniref:Uncharacterized protein n=1 Tax=Olea europaea subsp. europaea TaxID=158383 RepID=A0A8S0QWS6_OLEEU|nr:Hypothetical predicted protein [Olea europaea subsp. europaea]
MPDLDLIETLPDNDVAMIGMLYYITAYLFLRDYKKVKIVEPNVDRKGKGKMNLTADFVLPYTLESPSFDLGVGSTQPDIFHSEDIQKHVDLAILDVVTAIKTIDMLVFIIQDSYIM